MGFLILVIVTAVLGCIKKDASDTTGSGEKSSEFESKPTVGTVAVGGIPAESEIANLTEMEETEAVDAAQKINSVQGSLAIDIDNQSTAATLTEECSESFFCFAKTFTDIYNMVVEPAACNFNLLLGDGKSPKQLGDHPIYYVDGWGTIGLGENGIQQCPELNQISKFVQKFENNQHAEGDDFYFPIRLVLFKKSDGFVHWRLVFFPEDYIEKVSKRIRAFKGLVGKDLDFVGFNGYHDINKKVGEGTGNVVLNFTELDRMMKILNKTFGEGESQTDEGGFPSGRIDITYDFSNDPQKITTVFRDNFSFGDDDGFFQSDVPTTIMRSGNENYMHFYTSGSFIKNEDDPEEQTSPFQMVYLCDEGSLFRYVKDVPQSNYLSEQSTTHMQMIWNSLSESETKPGNYAGQVMQTKGGPYIYGSTIFEGAKKSGSLLDLLRIKTPICPSVQSRIDTNDFTFVSYVPIGKDGFVNALTTSDGSSGPSFLTSGQALEQYPAFSKFKFIDPTKKGESPVGTSGSTVAQSYQAPTKGSCLLPGGACSEYSNLSVTALQLMYLYCSMPVYDSQAGGDQGPTGLAGTWSFKNTCTNGVYSCAKTDFDFTYGDTTTKIGAVTSQYDSLAEVNSLEPCVAANGQMTPAISASCSGIASGALCVSVTDIKNFVQFGGSSNGQCEDSGSYNGTWNASSDVCSTGTKGTCFFGAGNLMRGESFNDGVINQSWCENQVKGVWQAP